LTLRGADQPNVSRVVWYEPFTIHQGYIRKISHGKEADMTSAIRVANYIAKNKHTYGEMQLQKLLYYAQAWSLAWTGRPLFGDEIEAWANGPVVRVVWASRKYDDYVVVDDGSELSDEETEIIDAVHAYYGESGGSVLGTMTHGEQPWIEARENLPANAVSSKPVSQATMRRFYTQEVVRGQGGPKRPLQSREATADEVDDAVTRQAKRWRSALDGLADR
jgi:uncharacterized phage-associated protein